MPELQSARSTERWVFLSAASATFLFFALTACPTVFFGDSGELIAASYDLGVAHPPGYPLYTFLGRCALLLPVGEPALRMNLLSAAFGALTCGCVAWLLFRWTSSIVAAAGASLSLAVSSTFWSTSTIAEVYSLHLLLIASLLALAVEAARTTAVPARRRALLGCALLVGLGLSHRPTILLSLPAAFLLAGTPFFASRSSAAGRREKSQATRATAPRMGWPVWTAALAGMIAVPVIFYAWLLLRSRAGPASNWGRPDDLLALFEHVTTRSYGSYVLGPAGWFRTDAWIRLGALAGSGFGYVGLPLAIVGTAGAGLGFRAARSWSREAAAVLALAVPALLFGLSYGTEDVEVLFLPLFLAISLAIGLGLAVIGQAPWKFATTAAGLLAAGAILASLWTNFRSCNLHHVRAAADYGRDMLDTVPHRGVLFVEGDDAFLAAYRIQVLGERPDITVFDRNGQIFTDELAEPGSPPEAGESPLAFRIRREQEFLARELRQRDPRAVLFMSWPGYELPSSLRFEPYGLFYLVRRAQDPPQDTIRLWAAYRESRIREQAARLRHPQALTAAATYPLMRGERALHAGRREEAFAAFDEASRLAIASESIHNYLGTIHGRLGSYSSAIREFEAAIRVKPVSVRAWNNLALARSLSGDVGGAREAWRRSLSIQPDQPDTRALLRRSFE